MLKNEPVYINGDGETSRGHFVSWPMWVPGELLGGHDAKCQRIEPRFTTSPPQTHHANQLFESFAATG